MDNLTIPQFMGLSLIIFLSYCVEKFNNKHGYSFFILFHDNFGIININSICFLFCYIKNAAYKSCNSPGKSSRVDILMHTGFQGQSSEVQLGD